MAELTTDSGLDSKMHKICLRKVECLSTNRLQRYYEDCRTHAVIFIAACLKINPEFLQCSLLQIDSPFSTGASWPLKSFKNLLGFFVDRLHLIIALVTTYSYKKPIWSKNAISSLIPLVCALLISWRRIMPCKCCRHQIWPINKLSLVERY